ncbi:YiiD C-terminal domain-containing protein [Devosia aurantiaca]|uniref:Thioesterase putative domain-containing protein n=1 Tax=Devosia aurantiaca TaxID=2714858 RepID=A0A6M1SPV7_9HYPH|nr:YiiD C-terminal domain-containing protein [Devosia aurantiaca]NGP16503.1 hypothetical protein [Devosia aurantiaca]
MRTLADLERHLSDQIPLSREMAVGLTAASSDVVTLQAPLTPNINYTGTAFGGSLYSVAVPGVLVADPDRNRERKFWFPDR